jgi:hypothetical protein
MEKDKGIILLTKGWQENGLGMIGMHFIFLLYFSLLPTVYIFIFKN